MIRVDGRECWALFDTGACNTYVVPAVAELLVTEETPHPMRAALGRRSGSIEGSACPKGRGGGIKEARKTAILHAEVEGRPISTHAMVVGEIGTDEDGRPIEMLFGALAMQQWGIRPVPDEEKLDLSHYPDEFVEFSAQV